MFVLVRVLAPMAVILFTCGAAATLREQRVADPSTGLGSFVNEARLSQQLPGLAVVIVRSDGQPQVYVSGERRIGKGDPITPADRMHLGSLTKAITATVIGALAEQHRMTLETTIGQAFPELSEKMQPAYRSVSVRQLLAHAGGVPQYRTRESLQWMLTLKGTASEQRYKFLDRVLAEPPRYEPGTRHEYSNAGGAIAGAMAERIGGAPYRQLVQELVFAPLGGNAAFANPGLAAEPQPWGHTRTIFGTVTEVAPADAVYTTPLAIEPAGDASPSALDYGRFLQLHLRGLRGRDGVLKATTIQDLHRKVAPINPVLGFVMGWVVMMRDGVESHEHGGSYGAYVAHATIQPSRDLAVGVFTNVGAGQDLKDAVAKLAMEIAARLSTDGKWD
jgi:CubicO group peptidase (beta-lactamase class C family)